MSGRFESKNNLYRCRVVLGNSIRQKRIHKSILRCILLQVVCKRIHADYDASSCCWWYQYKRGGCVNVAPYAHPPSSPIITLLKTLRFAYKLKSAHFSQIFDQFCHFQPIFKHFVEIRAVLKFAHFHCAKINTARILIHLRYIFLYILICLNVHVHRVQGACTKCHVFTYLRCIKIRAVLIFAQSKCVNLSIARISTKCLKMG